MKKLAALLFLLTLSAPVMANPPVIWSGSTIGQFLSPVIEVLLGNGYALVPSQAYFGDCSDGNVTISSGTTTLTRDMFYNNLTIGGTGQLAVANQRVFVCGTLDLSAAPAGAIDDTGGAGGNGGAGGAGGSSGNNVAVGTNLTGRAGTTGGAGNATAGTQAAAPSGGNVITGATAGDGGAGGSGATLANAGGVKRAAANVTEWRMRDITTWFVPSTGAGGQVFVAGGGPGGGGGGGDATSSGGGGGGGGASGDTIYLSAFILKTGGSSVANTIRANGGAAGNGGSPNGTCTLGCGGGGGGGVGGGGWVVIKYNTKTGTAVTNLVSAQAGAQGTGGTHKNTGGTDGATGSPSAAAGLIEILNLSTGAFTTSTTGTASL